MGTYVDGYYAFAPVTASDRRGLLYVAAILSLQFGAASVFGRLYIRRRNYGLDDIFLGISLVWTHKPISTKHLADRTGARVWAIRRSLRTPSRSCRHRGRRRDAQSRGSQSGRTSECHTIDIV